MRLGQVFLHGYGRLEIKNGKLVSVKEKLAMTLNALKIIKSKSLIDSSKTKSDYEDIYLKISEISDEYNELSSTFEKQDLNDNICFILEMVSVALGMISSYFAEIAMSYEYNSTMF
jgi:hypothetical protein